MYVNNLNLNKKKKQNFTTYVKFASPTLTKKQWKYLTSLTNIDLET